MSAFIELIQENLSSEYGDFCEVNPVVSRYNTSVN